jgi:hypothetical protein
LLWPSDGANPTRPACSAGPAVVGPLILMADASSNWGQVTGYKLPLDNAPPLL